MTKRRFFYKHEAIMRYARLLGFGDIHTTIDLNTGLSAIIAVHSTKLGPAIGGTRCFTYATAGLAIIDALRLSRTMTLKAAISGLKHGGAKAVLIKPRVIKDRQAYFSAYGDFVHELNGRYITAVDLGTSESDMEIIAQRTPFVFGAPSRHKLEVDPSPFTAQGVLRGIEAAVHHCFKRDTLDNVRVAIQGVGHVGYYLAKLLHKKGAKLTVCDPNPDAIARCVDEFKANVVALDEIYDVDCDIFSPSALGQVINFGTLNRLKAKIIAGPANAQLAHRKYSDVMHKKGILYAPDFVINAGGLIYAAMIYDYRDYDIANQQINQLYHTLLSIFERAAREQRPPLDIAEIMALEKLNANNDS